MLRLTMNYGISSKKGFAKDRSMTVIRMHNVGDGSSNSHSWCWNLGTGVAFCWLVTAVLMFTNFPNDSGDFSISGRGNTHMDSSPANKEGKESQECFYDKKCRLLELLYDKEHCCIATYSCSFLTFGFISMTSSKFFKNLSISVDCSFDLQA